MNILQVIRGLPIAAGTTTFVVEVANELVRQGHAVTIAVYCEPAPHDVALFDPRVTVMSIHTVLLGGNYDVVHLHALWSWDLHVVARWARRRGIPAVWSPHGALSPWARRSRWYKKLLPWLLWQRYDLKACFGLHATSAMEKRWLVDMGFDQPIVEVPLGTRLPEVDELRQGERTLLYVGRLHPVKGLENALWAWKMAGMGERGWRFRLVGPDQEEYLSVLKTLSSELGIVSSVDFAGPIYGEALKREYAMCGALILPSFSENFGATVVDALSYGKPVIASKGTPWQVLAEKGCGWWVETSVEGIAAGLKAAMGMTDAERGEMAKRARELVAERYSWKASAEKVVGLYEKCLN